jgi:hypothetical protein
MKAIASFVLLTLVLPAGLVAQDLIQDLGGATSGANGEPQLTVSGSMLFEQTLSVELTNARASTFVALVFGVSEANTPVGGGILIPSQDIVINVMTNSLGEFAQNYYTPDFEGTLYVQCAILDDDAQGDVALSNAMSCLAGTNVYAAGKEIAVGGEQIVGIDVIGTAAQTYQVFVTSGTPPVRTQLVAETPLSTPSAQEFFKFLPRALVAGESVEVVGATSGRRSKPYGADARLL